MGTKGRPNVNFSSKPFRAGFQPWDVFRIYPKKTAVKCIDTIIIDKRSKKASCRDTSKEELQRIHRECSNVDSLD